MQYHEYTNLGAYDQTIASHIYMDACNGSIAYRLLQAIGFPCNAKKVLDLGAGTGQVSRFLGGFPGLIVEACDADDEAVKYFRSDAELRNVPFHQLDFLADELPHSYDGIVARGIYHHLPKSARPQFLKKMTENAQVFILADEGIREYHSEEERLHNCASWYGLVIKEARRRGFDQLAEIESSFLKHEQMQSADDGGDYKESPTQLIDDAKQVGLKPAYIDRYGPWNEYGGGFYTATFLR
jgi:SAM-dependent methyltransferase